MTERKTVTREEKIALGWTRAEIVDRLARIMRNAMGPEFWDAPPPEWAERAAETIWQNVEAMVRDRLETDRAEIELLRAKVAALPESADEELREALAARQLIAEMAPDYHYHGLIRDHADPNDKTGWHVKGIETCGDPLCVEAVRLVPSLAALAATLPEPGEGS